MWIVSIRDNELEELYDVLVYGNEDLQELFDFIKMSPNLSLYHIEERWVCPTVELFIEEQKENGGK